MPLEKVQVSNTDWGANFPWGGRFEQQGPPQLLKRCRTGCLVGEIGGTVDLDHQHARQPRVVALRPLGLGSRGRWGHETAPRSPTTHLLGERKPDSISDPNNSHHDRLNAFYKFDRCSSITISGRSKKWVLVSMYLTDKHNDPFHQGGVVVGGHNIIIRHSNWRIGRDSGRGSLWHKTTQNIIIYYYLNYLPFLNYY